VRQPLAVSDGSRRRFEERLAMRFPSAVALATRAVLWLPPRSRFRQVMIRRGARIFLEAYNRKDFESTYAVFHPDAETVVPQQLVEMGFEAVTRGDNAALRVQRRWHADWDEFRIEPDEVIDLDTRVLLLGRIRFSGRSSGAGMTTEWGNLVTVARGWAIREQVYFDRNEALAAAGLSE
jgi:ketosteroid isomerase-like protein